MDAKLISMSDRLQTAIGEIFTERGYDVDITLPENRSTEENEEMGFSVNPKGVLIDKETIDDIIKEGFKRIGIKMKKEI